MSEFVPYHEKSYTDGFFHVCPANGFLPVRDPLVKVPERYSEVQRLIDDLSIHIVYEGEGGVLSRPNEIEARVNSLPNYAEVAAGETDVFVIQALYRAYTFIASGYTLELSYQEFLKSGNYGKARRFLPAQVAKPLVIVSEKLDVYPFLDYHYAYSLGNYVKTDPNGTLHWKNLQMACKFSGTPDETGFIMLHVYINELTPALMTSVFNVGKGTDMKHHLRVAGESMDEINARRKEMWIASRHERYNDFRIFIMGIKGNEELYGDGVVYDTCFNNEPQQYRGQTGAQDSIIPMMDIFTGIVDFYPENKLTEYLLDLRTYRPKCIQNFFIDLRAYYAANPLFKTLKEGGKWDELVYLLRIVDEVYLFRNGHWQFVQKYIMANTKYEKATGGTPITSWLINQIEAVLEYERVILAALEGHTDALEEHSKGLWGSLSESYPRKRKLLADQVVMLREKDINVTLVHQANYDNKLQDDTLAH